MNKNRNNSLDGVRALAITLVVMSHTGILLQGGFGNDMFFCLSGFLASVPFKESVEKNFLSVKYTINYYWGRLVRILPVYYVVIVGYYFLARGFFSDKINLLKNMLFIEANSHLWFLQQQMVMYLCVPFIFLLLVIIKNLVKTKYSDLICGIFLILAAFAAQKWLTAEVFSLYGNGGRQMLRIGQFLIGFATGYFYKVYNKSGFDIGKNRLVKAVCEIIVLGVCVFAVLSAEPVLKQINPAYEGYFIGWQKPMFCSAITAVLVVALLLHPNGFMSKIFGWKPIAYIGEISFVIYLVHMFIIPYCNFATVYRKFLGVYFVSICVAVVLHILVEKPANIFAKTKSITGLLKYYRDL